jgi:hypothetical protein
MFYLNQDAMKDLKEIPLLNLLAALGLLWVGIDRMFFDRIVGSDPLAMIERTLTIVVGILLCTLGVSLLVAAWKVRFPVSAMDTNSIAGKLLVNAFCAAPSAFVFGVVLVRTLTHFDSLYLTVTVLFGASLIADLFWTRREVQRLASSETAKKHASQLLWSCIFFSMLSFMFGMALSGYVWFRTDFMRTFGVVFWGAMTAVAIYPVRRDAKRLADVVVASHITSVQGEQG